MKILLTYYDADGRRMGHSAQPLPTLESAAATATFWRDLQGHKPAVAVVEIVGSDPQYAIVALSDEDGPGDPVLNTALIRKSLRPGLWERRSNDGMAPERIELAEE